MTREKFSRNAAVTSQAIITVWLAVQLLASVFQLSLIGDLVQLESELPRVSSWEVTVLCAGGLCVIGANFMICRKKGKKAPLLLTAITSGLLPIAARLVGTAQFNSFTSAAEEYQALSVYSKYIVQPISYLLYVSVFVTIAAAAVYAFGGSETFPRKVSIASQVVLIVWTALQLLSSLFQKSVFMRFTGLRENELDDVGRINSYPAIVLCLGGLLIIAANFLICQKKGKLAPLLIVSITTGLLPIVSSQVDMLQSISASFDGLDNVYAVGVYNGLVGTLSYLLYVGAALAVVAAVVRIFAENKDTAGNDIPEEIKKENDLL